MPTKRHQQHVHQLPWPALLLVCMLSTMLHPPASADAATDGNGPIDWQPHQRSAFDTAAAEGRYLLLDLEAVWCHWCHVMDATTWQDAEVAALIARHFVPLKADHDARPDLAERYRDWGWPAIIVLAPDGTEIVKRAGYIAPQDMARLLQTIVDDPSPEGRPVAFPSELATAPQLDASTEQALLKRHIDSFDSELGGLRIAQKFLDPDAIELDLQLAADGDQQALARARLSLNAALQLIDPAFGGAYQYSTHYDWKHPHYEKIMRTQWAYLRSYSRAYAELGEPRYLIAAKAIAAWLDEFMSAPDGAFYTSQDADLKQGSKGHAYFALDRDARLQLGLPRIDKHRYSAVNGMAIEGLTRLYQASGEAAYLQRAKQALAWVLKERAYYGGGFRHDRRDEAGPYLGDTLYVGRAMLALYEATDDPAMLAGAIAAAAFMQRYFRHPQAGLSSAVDNGTPVEPLPQLDQNLHAADFLLDLYALSADPQQRKLAAHVLRYLVTPEVALSRSTDAGILSVAGRYAALDDSGG